MRARTLWPPAPYAGRRPPTMSAKLFPYLHQPGDSVRIRRKIPGVDPILAQAPRPTLPSPALLMRATSRANGPHAEVQVQTSSRRSHLARGLRPARLDRDIQRVDRVRPGPRRELVNQSRDEVDFDRDRPGVWLSSLHMRLVRKTKPVDSVWLGGKVLDGRGECVRRTCEWLGEFSGHKDAPFTKGDERLKKKKKEIQAIQTQRVSPEKTWNGKRRGGPAATEPARGKGKEKDTEIFTRFWWRVVCGEEERGTGR